MEILYFISEEKDTILTVIGLILAAIGVIVAVIFSGDDSKKQIIRTVILAIVGLFIVMAITVSAIHFWVMRRCFHNVPLKPPKEKVVNFRAKYCFLRAVGIY